MAQLGVMVGLEEEARLIRQFFPDVLVALSHAHEAGAHKALRELQQAGATDLLSFGCAGGLDPALKPGTVLVAESVVVGHNSVRADEKLSQRFGAGQAQRGKVFHSPVMVGAVAEKQRLRAETDCVAVDMESGIVAQSGLPFAVLRVICDDAARPLPPAAEAGLREGRVYLPGLLGSLLRHPGQIGALMALGRDAGLARRSMKRFLGDLAV